MSETTIERVSLNTAKFKQVRGDTPLAEHAEKIGLSIDMLSKIERGQRWRAPLERFAEFCQKTNQEPNAFFEIVKKIS